MTREKLSMEMPCTEAQQMPKREQSRTYTVIEGRCKSCGWLIFRDRSPRILASHRVPKECPRCHASGKPRIFKGKHTDRFAERIDPSRFDFSAMFTAIVGAIIGHDYSVREKLRGGLLSSISISSDGFVIGGSTASDGGGAFVIGKAADLDRDLALYRENLVSTDREAFDNLYRANVMDFRRVLLQ